VDDACSFGDRGPHPPSCSRVATSCVAWSARLKFLRFHPSVVPARVAARCGSTPCNSAPRQVPAAAHGHHVLAIARPVQLLQCGEVDDVGAVDPHELVTRQARLKGHTGTCATRTEQGRAKPNAQAALLIRMMQGSRTLCADLPRSEVPTRLCSLLRCSCEEQMSAARTDARGDFCGNQSCFSLLGRDNCNGRHAARVSGSSR
jgi:hypothetical protein